MKLSGRNAIITGANQDLGFEITQKSIESGNNHDAKKTFNIVENV